jgi:hypothetical protein
MNRVRLLPSPPVRPHSALGSFRALTAYGLGTMSQTPFLRETIEAMLARNRVTKIEGRVWIVGEEDQATAADRAFLEAWRKQADDPIWSRTVALVQAELPGRRAARWIAMIALRTNRWADGVGAGVDSFFDLARENHRKHLELADYAEALAKYIGGLDKETAADYNHSQVPVCPHALLSPAQVGGTMTARSTPTASISLSISSALNPLARCGGRCCGFGQGRSECSDSQRWT